MAAQMNQDFRTFVDRNNQYLDQLTKSFYSELSAHYQDKTKARTKFNFNGEEFRDRTAKGIPNEYLGLYKNELDKKLGKLRVSADFIDELRNTLIQELRSDDTEYIESEELLKKYFIDKFQLFYQIHDKEFIDPVMQIFRDFKNRNLDIFRSILAEHKKNFDNSVKQYSQSVRSMTAKEFTDDIKLNQINQTIRLYKSLVKSALDKKYPKITDEFVSELRQRLSPNFQSRDEMCQSLIEFVYKIFCDNYEKAIKLKNNGQDHLKIKLHLIDWCADVLKMKCFNDNNLKQYSHSFVAKFREMAVNYSIDNSKNNETIETEQNSLLGKKFFEQMSIHLDQLEWVSEIDPNDDQVKNKMIDDIIAIHKNAKVLDDFKINIEAKWTDFQFTLKEFCALSMEMNERDANEPDKLKDQFEKSLTVLKSEEMIFLFLRASIKLFNEIQEQKNISNISSQVSEEVKTALGEDILSPNSIKAIFEEIRSRTISSYTNRNYFQLFDELDKIGQQIQTDFASVYHSSQTDLDDFKKEFFELYLEKMEKVKPGDSFEQTHNSTILVLKKIFTEKVSELKVKYNYNFVDKKADEILNEILSNLEKEKLKYLSQNIKDKINYNTKNKGPAPPIPSSRIKNTTNKIDDPNENIQKPKTIGRHIQTNEWIAVHFSHYTIDSVGFTSTDYSEADIEYLLKDKKSISFKERTELDITNIEKFEQIITNKLSQIMKKLTHTKNIVLTVPLPFLFKERFICKKSAENLKLESIKILSEPFAAAIGYSIDPQTLNIKTSKTIFFIIVNGIKCYGTIFLIGNNFVELFYITGPEYFDNRNKNIKLIQTLVSLFENAEINDLTSDEIVVVGQSKHIGEMKCLIKNTFPTKNIIDVDPIEVITTGSIIYGLIVSKDNFDLDLLTCLTSSLYYELNCEQQVIKTKFIKKKDIIVYKQMTWMTDINHVMYSPDQLCELYIFENDIPIFGVKILSLPDPNAEKITLELNVEIKELTDIQLKLFQSDGTDKKKVETKTIDVNKLNVSRS